MGRILLFLSYILIVMSYKMQKIVSQSISTQTYVIVATNDIHGGAFPTQMIRSDTKEKYTYGGMVYLADMIDTIRKQYGSDNVLYLDGGDQYQGGIQASELVSSGKIMNQFFNTQAVDATAIGNHEFDNGPQFLYRYLNNNLSPYLAANLYSQKNQPVNQFLANSKRSQMFVLNNNIKIGVIGLITQDTPFTSSGFTKHLFPDYQFKDYAAIVEAQSKALKANGANAIIVLAHQGNSCPGQSMQNKIWKNQTKQDPCPQGSITKLLDTLPQGTVDAIVQGHKHEIVHFYKNNIPIVGTNNGGFYFNLLYLTFDKSKRKIVDTSIEGPIPICEKIFSIQKRCNYIPPEEINNVGELVNWKFHNKIVSASLQLQAIYNQWLPKMAPYFEDLVQNQVYLEVSKNGQSQLGNLVSDLYFNAVKGADFSLVNPGSFRTTWIPGIIQYQHFYNMFPFSNLVQKFSILGSELKKMYQILQSGAKGFYISTGLKMTLTASPKSLVSITMSNGDQIIDDKQYIGVTSDFMLLGGDDMAQVISSSVYIPRNVVTIGELRTTLKPILKQQGVILPNTLIDPNNPRVIVI